MHFEGTQAELIAAIKEAGKTHHEPYVEAVLTSDEVEPLLVEKLTAVAQEAGVLLIATRNERALQRYQEEESTLVALNELSPREVFRLLVTEESGAKEGEEAMPKEDFERYQRLLMEAVDGVQTGHWPMEENE